VNKITSAQNPKIKAVIKLREKRERDKTQKFIIEGYRELERASLGKVSFSLLFYSPKLFLGSNEMKLIEKIEKKGAELIELPDFLFEKISYRDRPDGLLAIANQKRLKLSDVDFGKNPFLVVAESIEKPGNLGSILRSCDATGVDALIVCDPRTDIYNPNVVRASVGTLFTIPVIQATGEEVLEYLKKNKIQIVATTPAAQKEYTEIDLKGPAAVAVGTEQLGLTDAWLKKADLQVSIPMLGIADSLNVAAATTLLLYEVVRQRRS